MKAGTYVGTDRAGEEIGEGKVAKSGRWWSYDWWFGHWLDHRSCGQWREDGGPYRCTEDHGHAGEHRWAFSDEPATIFAWIRERKSRKTPGRKQSDRERQAGEYRAYLEARYRSAEAATRGTFVNPAGRARGITSRAWFSGRRAGTRYASDELRDWLAANGPTLTATEYHRQHREPIHPYDF